MCLHTEIEPYEDEPTRGGCVDCGEEFGLRGTPANTDDAADEDVDGAPFGAEPAAAA